MVDRESIATMKVAIVGAGITGLACAARLSEGGLRPVLFDKGKRPGGRLSTLRLDAGSWDFGAQYLEAGEGPFAEQVRGWQQAGVLAPWPSGPAGSLVGVPAMASLVEAACAGRDVRFGAQVQRIDYRGRRWSLAGGWLAEGPFDAVILALPAEQAAPLLALHDLQLAREAAASRSQPCWSLMLAFAAPLAGVPDFLRSKGPIAFAARNSSKPGRPAGECWVIQADAAWSKRHLEWEPASVAAALGQAFAAAAGLAALPEPTFAKAHRWRFGMAPASHTAPLWNPELRLGACGDWCGGRHISGAWQAGTDLAEKVLSALAGPTMGEREFTAVVERVAGIEPA
jgi:renalase